MCYILALRNTLHHDLTWESSLSLWKLLPPPLPRHGSSFPLHGLENEFIHCFHGTWTPVREQRDPHTSRFSVSISSVSWWWWFSRRLNLWSGTATPKWPLVNLLEMNYSSNQGFCCGQLHSFILRWTMMGDCLTRHWFATSLMLWYAQKMILNKLKILGTCGNYCRHCEKKRVSRHTAT